MEEQDSTNSKVKIIIAENQAIILHALAALISRMDDFEIIGLVNDGHELMARLAKDKPDVILMNLRRSGMNGVESARILDEKTPWVRIISLTRHNHPIYIRDMLKLGVKGFLSTDCTVEELREAITSVYKGKTYFCTQCSAIMIRAYSSDPAQDEFDLRSVTPRELEVMRHLANGQTTREIAATMFISAKTVERHKSNMLKKFKSRNTAHMVKNAIENGLIM
jgi:DNA-binding NarL/FixJ family response regulator